MTIRRRCRFVALLTLVIAACAAEGRAFWTAPGAGSAVASSASLAGATIATPASAVNSVTVTWTQQASLAPSSSANSSITYSLERRLGGGPYAAVSSGGCSGTLAYGIASCIDAPGATGSYSYRTVAHFATWTATSNESGPLSFLLDTTDPTVQSITRAGATPNNAASVIWTITFSEAVTGVDAADFTLARTGALSGGAISSVTGSGMTYTITSTTGSGDGTLGLNLTDNDTITDAATNKLGGSGTGNGTFTGQTYTIDKTAPAAPSAISVTSGVVFTPPPTCSGVTSGTRYINGTGTANSASTTTMTAAVTAEAGLTIVFSATGGATTVTSSPLPATASPVTPTQNLSSLPDGPVALSAYTVDAAGNPSTTATATPVLRKDTVAPTLTAAYHATGGGFLGLGPHLDGTSDSQAPPECGAAIRAVKASNGSLFTATVTSSTFDIDPVDGPPLLGSVSYSVTSTDRAGNVSTPVITGS